VGWSGTSLSFVFRKLSSLILDSSQTLGTQYTVDGRFRGSLNVTTINCDTTANTCVVPVTAPGFALVFFDSNAEPLSIGQATETFATTARTKFHNTATYDPAALSTSNGHSGMGEDGFGSTSVGSISKATRGMTAGGVGMVLGSAILGGVWIVRGLLR
jgi:hypothetical protein